MSGEKRTYTEGEIRDLTDRVRGRMSERRFRHTLGVAAMAEKLGRLFCPDRVSALRVAALLHDVAKELPEEEQYALMQKSGVPLDESDLLCPPIFHSFAGKSLILRDFPTFADEEILSAVASHTVGRPDMSLFEEIVFLSDFIEEGRPYPSSISLRERLFGELEKAESENEKICALHRAAVSAAELTLQNLVNTGKPIGKTLVLTRDSIKAKISQN